MLVEVVEFDIFLSQFIAVVVIVCLSYVLNKYFVFLAKNDRVST